MKMPFWKIKRELRDAYHQFVALLIRPLFPFIRLARFILPSRGPKKIKGSIDLGGRIVVYLIYPDGDKLDDRVEAMDYFRDGGASIICVVNGSISDRWLARFSARCAHVLVRTNKGYDFGGYQCGINFLQGLGHTFDHLHVINDSIILPVVRNDDLIYEIEAATKSGFGGAVGLPTENGLINSGLALSYWLYFSGAIARSVFFQAYWFGYVATSSKVLTVRYGERGLSRHMAKHGSPPQTLHTIESTLARIEQVDSGVLASILRYGSFSDEAFSARCAQLLVCYADTDDWSTSARVFIRDVAIRRNFLHSFCFLTFAVLKLPFIKKSNVRLALNMRRQYVAAVRNGELPRPSEAQWDKIIHISRCS